ncbi:MAG TPA: anti-sigma factor [Candidatus Udaeobacter sp.]|nr:anti-sigma factor [Candidatus Udaeobacter sp.]
MIPSDSEELHVLAGEYVLGVLEPEVMNELALAAGSNPALSLAIAYWEERLHGLSRLALPADPPPQTWARIAERIAVPAMPARRIGLWNCLGFWRGSAALATAVAASLALYIALAPRPAALRFVAVLHSPQQEPAAWIATAVGNGLLLRAVASVAAPGDRSFELWAIGPSGGAPKALGVVPANGQLEIGALPEALEDGATLAISIEPKAGSPAGRPTGPVVFLGRLNTVRP